MSNEHAELLDTLDYAACNMRSEYAESKKSMFAAIGILGCAGLPSAMAERLIQNLRVAVYYGDPDLAIGYCRGAEFEIRAWKERKS